MADEKLVTIARFSHPEEAHIVSARLESEGIWSFVADEFTVKANWLYSNAIGGVRLQVKESDVAVARKILSSTEPDATLTSGTGQKCPRCGSSDIKYGLFYLSPLFLSWLLLDFPLPFIKRKWSCNNCGYRWKNQS